jgi:hypothetical protein
MPSAFKIDQILLFAPTGLHARMAEMRRGPQFAHETLLFRDAPVAGFVAEH